MTRLSFKLALLPVFLLTLTTSLLAQEYAFHQYYNFANDAAANPCKPFIGVGTSNVYGGLKVDYTVDNTPATTYGLQAGDVILALDGVPVRTQSELLRERDKHQTGDAFTLTLIRNGSEQTIKARFKECSESELKAATETAENLMAEKEAMALFKDLEAFRNHAYFNTEKMSERPILGVYENTNVNADGLVIERVIAGKGAALAGLQEGDVVTKVDGKTITGSTTLRNALDGHAVGDRVNISYVRDGKTIKTELTLSADQYSFNQNTRRDPCKAFIGVYTSTNSQNGGGTRVEGVIDETPAKEAGIQPGDVILAFDGQPINSYDELTRERDKKKAGDAFRLTISRNGSTMQIKARFKPCDAPSATKESVELLDETKGVEQREAPKQGDNSLKLEVLEAYPNPTYGLVNIKFEAEALPTTVQILDVTGKVVYNKNLPKFDGSFNEQVNLSNNNAGNYVLSIRQGDQVRTKQIVLLPRA